jgi:hypothetical protein
MRKQQAQSLKLNPMRRFAFMFLGSMFLGLGILTLLSGALHYQNWWGAPVFAPFAIAIGALCFVVAFRHRTLLRK